MRDLDRILFSVSPNVRQNNGLSRHHLTRYKYVNTGVSNVITSISTDDHDDMMGPRSTDTQSSIQVAHVLQQNITGKITPDWT